MKKICLFLFFTAVSQLTFSQSFSSLSRPEKFWTIAHIFVAKRAFVTTKKVMKDIDSLKYSGRIGADNNGGNLDAVKHAYWMASVALKIGSGKATKLGKAHEKGNYLQFRHHQHEDAVVPDSVSSAMDLYNNKEGIFLTGKCRTGLTEGILLNRVLDALKGGSLMVIKKDMHGNFLTCENEVIDLSVWKGKWAVPKCMVASSQ